MRICLCSRSGRMSLNRSDLMDLIGINFRLNDNSLSHTWSMRWRRGMEGGYNMFRITCGSYKFGRS
jgi:hypothetical protein